jgi:hypothetical protein
LPAATPEFPPEPPPRGVETIIRLVPNDNGWTRANELVILQEDDKMETIMVTAFGDNLMVNYRDLDEPLRLLGRRRSSSWLVIVKRKKRKDL